MGLRALKRFRKIGHISENPDFSGGFGFGLITPTIIMYHLGIDQPDEKTMTFQDLAIRINYNSPSEVEKAYKRAVDELRRQVNAGEYGRWINALRLIRETER